jgi:hypothetical protein
MYESPVNGVEAGWWSACCLLFVCLLCTALGLFVCFVHAKTTAAC